MKLRQREIPLITFRRTLPWWLAWEKEGDVPKGEKCFVEFDARAGGSVNPVYVAGGESLVLQSRIMDRKVNKITDDAEAEKTNAANIKVIRKARYALLYDACVIDWRTNILNADSGAPIECTKDTFLQLEAARVPEINQVLSDFEDECLAAGKEVLEADQDILKN